MKRTTMPKRSLGINSNGVAVTAAMSQERTKKPKRRNERNILTFYEKIAVIRYYNETNISRNSLAKMFHCCATQIRRILDRKQELLQQLATLSEADASIIIEEMTRKRRKFEMSAISFILHQWVERCRQMRLSKSITNETLKDTAIKMAAILNLPAFRPSYRWLNRFRDKYKYNDEDLGSGNGFNTVSGELAVEDIIIEYKDALPSFMQKEISAITSSAKVDVDPMLTSESFDKRRPSNDDNTTTNENDENSREDFEISDDDDDEEINENLENENEKVLSDNDETVQVNTAINGIETSSNQPKACLANDSSKKFDICTAPEFSMLNAGSAALLQSIFPHLAVIHQFALLNSDVKALELISQLGVHMQIQAAEGAYKQLSLATSGVDTNDLEVVNDNLYPDIDDIVLME